MTLLPLLAAAEQSPPLIDLDGTIFLQFGIFVAMMAILYRFVFRPFFAVQDERSRRIEGARSDADAMQTRSTTMIADYEARLIQAKQRGAEERLRLRAEGTAHENEVIGKARAAGQAAMSQALDRARAQETEARTRLLADSQSIAREVVARILGRAAA
jgi:F-type H+-transporting ATPase subunit b